MSIFQDHTVVSEIASKYKMSDRQILMRWGLQHDYVLAPHLVAMRPEESLMVLDFKLDQSDMSRLDTLHAEGVFEMY